MDRRITDRLGGGMSSPQSGEDADNDDDEDSAAQPRIPLGQEQHHHQSQSSLSSSHQPARYDDDDESLINLVTQAVATKGTPDEEENLVFTSTRRLASYKERILRLTAPTNRESGGTTDRTYFESSSDHRANTVENNNDDDNCEEEQEEIQSMIVRGAVSELGGNAEEHHSPLNEDDEVEGGDEQHPCIPTVLAVPVLNEISNAPPTIRDNNNQDGEALVRQLLLHDIESVTAIPVPDQEGRPVSAEEIHLLQRTVSELHSRLQEQDELVRQLRVSLERLSSTSQETTSTTAAGSTSTGTGTSASPAPRQQQQRSGAGAMENASSVHDRPSTRRRGPLCLSVIAVSCAAVFLGAIVGVFVPLGSSNAESSSGTLDSERDSSTIRPNGTVVPTEPPQTDSSPTPPPSASSQKTDLLSTGAIVAIVVASVDVVVALSVLGTIAAVRYRKRRAMSQPANVLPSSHGGDASTTTASAATNEDERQQQTCRQQQRGRQEAAILADLNKALTNRAETARQLRAVYLKTKLLSSALSHPPPAPSTQRE